MASITEYLEKLQKLTQTNCEILKAINDSFFTKNSYLTASVDNNTYTIPSFISLENKINALTENFNNLVYAPKTGEATFNFDGASQTIELKGFNCTPEHLELNSPEYFKVENNQIFKDFLSPSPYINFDVKDIPNDINKVVIKKIVAMSDKMKSEFSSRLMKIEGQTKTYITSTNIPYEDIYKLLSYYTKDVDYVEYDTIKQLPIRNTLGTGTYTIASIDDHEIDDDLYETYVVTIKEDLKYKLFDNVIGKNLQVGDELVTFDNSAKMKIIEVRSNTKQLKLEVLNGDYVNLVADITGSENDIASDLSKLKFYSSINFDKDKNINVAIEEDQYIAVFISPLNDRMNIRAPWGNGVIVDTFKLTLHDNEGELYGDYYNKYINNVGDILYELTSIATNGITKYSKDEFDVFTKYKPQILLNDLVVYQINSHLNNSPTIQKIRNLYNQKLKYNSELEEIQKNIDNINSTLASISFDDTTNIRTVYESQLVEYNKKRNELTSALNSVSNEIAMAANNSEIPIENAKYHIRGFFNNPNDTNLTPYWNHINGIRVWYRYKNKDQETGNAHSIGDNIFSDWNEMPITRRLRQPQFKGQKYEYSYKDTLEKPSSEINEPSYNQIDIPISQGETVDIKLQVLWDFGYPYIETTSSWSDVVSIPFPEEYKKNVQVLDIISENNNDIETNRFNNILREEGLITHVGDKLTDQDLTYFHQPEHIASGFYTQERRVIPLKDQLLDFKNEIASLKDEVFGYSANNLRIDIYMDNINTVISQNQTNTVYFLEGVKIVNLQILNNSSDHTAKLYPLIIGSRNNPITDTNFSGFYVKNKNNKEEPQRMNQFLYFRSKDAWTGESLYNNTNTNNPPLERSLYGGVGTGSNIAPDTNIINNTQNVHPIIKSDYQLCVNSDSKFDYLEIKPKESIVIPMEISGGGGIMQFTLKTSLYSDPISYEVLFTQNTDSMFAAIKQSQSNTQYNSIIK